MSSEHYALILALAAIVAAITRSVCVIIILAMLRNRKCRLKFKDVSFEQEAVLSEKSTGEAGSPMAPSGKPNRTYKASRKKTKETPTP